MGFNIAAAGQAMQGAFKQGEDAAALLLQQQQAKQAELTTGALPERLAQEAAIRQGQASALEVGKQKALQEIASAKQEFEFNNHANPEKLRAFKLETDRAELLVQNAKTMAEATAASWAVQQAKLKFGAAQAPGAEPGVSRNEAGWTQQFNTGMAQGKAAEGAGTLSSATSKALLDVNAPDILAKKQVAESALGITIANMGNMTMAAKAKKLMEPSSTGSGMTYLEELTGLPMDEAIQSLTTSIVKLKEEAKNAPKLGEASVNQAIANVALTKSGTKENEARAKMYGTKADGTPLTAADWDKRYSDLSKPYQDIVSKGMPTMNFKATDPPEVIDSAKTKYQEDIRKYNDALMATQGYNAARKEIPHRADMKAAGLLDEAQYSPTFAASTWQLYNDHLADSATPLEAWKKVKRDVDNTRAKLAGKMKEVASAPPVDLEGLTPREKKAYSIFYTVMKRSPETKKERDAAFAAADGNKNPLNQIHKVAATHFATLKTSEAKRKAQERRYELGLEDRPSNPYAYGVAGH